MIEKLWELPPCGTCGNTGLVKFRDVVLGEKMGPCKRCEGIKKRLKILKGTRLPPRFDSLEIGDLTSSATFLRGTVSHSEGAKGFEGVTHQSIGACLTAYRDMFIVCADPNVRIVIAATLIRDVVLRGGLTALFVTTEEILISALEQSKYSASPRDAPLDFERVEEVDFLIVDGAHEICGGGAMTGPMRSIVNNVFKNRRFSGKRNIFLSAYTHADIQWVKLGGFINEIVQGADVITTKFKMR